MRPGRLAPLLLLVLLACATHPSDTNAPADLVFFGTHILTVDEATRGAQAVAVRGDRIAAVGSRAEVEALVGDRTRVVELGERALTPGFIDAHGHLLLVMQFLGLANVSSPPVGPAERIEDVLEVLRAKIRDENIAPGEWVLGYGYDDSLLAEGRHPTRDDLDQVSTEHPIALLHVSAHLATSNSAALEATGMGSDTPDPPGGVIRRRAGGSEPNGVLEETAAHKLLGRIFEGADVDPRQFAANVFRALEYHAAHGITTVQDGASNPLFLKGLAQVAAARALPVDVAAFPAVNDVPLGQGVGDTGYSREYVDGLRIAGVKFVLDGSPQGRTAWLTQPYDEGPPGAPDDYVAYPIIEPERYVAKVAPYIEAGIPILVHANGDAAVDLMMDGVAMAIGDERPDHRSVAIHAQVTRPDQLDRMKDLGVIPSFFSAHTFFWGDWHRVSFGEARAAHTSPLGGALRRGVRFTIHNDAPVVPPHILRLIEVAVTRTTRGGDVLGPDQRLTVEQALHAVTLGAAYAYFEEGEKGSITPGKRADLVVLGRDPREVDPHDISEIEVVETFARGRSVYPTAR